jgi:hypothetical protein
MYFLLVSLIYLTFAQISVKTVSEQGFFIQIDHVSNLDRVYWVAHTANEALSIKELMNGVSSLGLGCSGEVTKRQLMKRPQLEIQCQLQFGKQYTLDALVIKGDDDYEILTTDFTLNHSRGSQRRLLGIEGTGEASDTTYEPSGTGEASDTTGVPSTSNAPSSTGQASDTTAVPSSSSSTTTSLPKKEENDGSTFAGFDLSSGGGISLFVFAILLILAVLGLIIGGPYLYRRYYTTFGAKTVEVSPKAAAKLSEISKSKLGSSFQSESKIEIAPIKSEDKIALMDPVE